MNPCDVIMKKRLGQALSREEIHAFVRGACDGTFADYQISAMLMAICIRGMDDRETVDLTMEMADSGERLDLSGVSGPTVDKHSTGGVGDTTTLIVAPLCAACGAKVAKMSGRGLGFTGGTLDKLESIPGVRVDLSARAFIDQVNDIGLAVVGQSRELAPADKKLYALRDVTATVDSLPLVASSILSKKIAAGCGSVVLDVKAGSGAIMPTPEKSIELAETMVRIGCSTGHRFSALVTNMDQPLGQYVGNALEVREAIEVLSGRASGELLVVSLALGAQMLKSCGLAASREEATDQLIAALRDGRVLNKLADMIEAQGGDRRVAFEPDRLPKAKTRIGVPAEKSGYVHALATSEIGYAAQALGAGRVRADDVIDPAAGLIMKKRLGEYVAEGEIWCELHVGDHSDVDAALHHLQGALTLTGEPIRETRPLIYRVIEREEGT